MYSVPEHTALFSEPSQQAIREQMNRLLQTHHFRNSRRYPALLRFIVEETLAGRGEYLKERLLGVQVFDRPADYDTASDPIVRVTIAEIRKRIAQYYHDEAHTSELRIELLPGRYVPEFRVAREPVQSSPMLSDRLQTLGQTVDHGSAQADVPLLSAPDVPVALPRGSRTGLYLKLAAAVSALVLLPLLTIRWIQPPALDQLWAPVLASGQSMLFCIPTDVGKKRDALGSDPATFNRPGLERKSNFGGAHGTTFLEYESLGENVVYSDMLAVLKIANVLALHHREYRVRLNVSTTLEDLRQGPAVLIGGLDNQWTMRATAPLRYHFEGSDEDRYWIADGKNPADRSWSLDLKQQYALVNRDYAIIARLHNDQTGQVEVIVAGIGMSGTAAAGEFVADERQVKELRRRVGSGFKNRDFEAVLSMDVVNGIPGSPRILAVAVQ